MHEAEEEGGPPSLEGTMRGPGSLAWPSSDAPQTLTPLRISRSFCAQRDPSNSAHLLPRPGPAPCSPREGDPAAAAPYQARPGGLCAGPSPLGHPPLALVPPRLWVIVSDAALEACPTAPHHPNSSPPRALTLETPFFFFFLRPKQNTPHQPQPLFLVQQSKPQNPS